MTADLGRWMLAERLRLQRPTPPVMQKVLLAVSGELDAVDGTPPA